MAKKYKINISFNAQKDLEHIFFYIAEDSINNAKNFILELEEKIYSLDTMPERFALIPKNIFFNTNYRHIIHKKYRVISQNKWQLRLYFKSRPRSKTS